MHFSQSNNFNGVEQWKAGGDVAQRSRSLTGPRLLNQ